MSSPGRNRVFLFIASTGGLPQSEVTFAKSLKQLNYSTALIGKWHLGKDCYRYGDNCHHPLNHGFDYFYGTPLTNLKDFGNDHQSVITTYYPRFHIIIITIFVVGLSLAAICRHHNCPRLALVAIVLLCLLPLLVLSFQMSIKTLNSVLYENDRIVQQPIELKSVTSTLVGQAVQFMTNQTKANKPFLLLVNFVKVHTGKLSILSLVDHST